jgi:transcriptional regulator with XRE-family HTH domain
VEELDFCGLGNRIRKQREYLGYTRDYLAEQLSVSTNFCRDIEIGAKGISIQTLVKLSKILKLSTDYILFGQSVNKDATPIIQLLESCKPDKQKYAEDILKSFILALE